MPVYDWSQVDAGMYHHFHDLWITRLSDASNHGVLPLEYYALVERHAGQYLPDILTLHARPAEPPLRRNPAPKRINGGLLTVTKSPSRVREQLMVATYRTLRRTFAIRHTSGHRLVAVVEITCAANKDWPNAVTQLVRRIVGLLHHSVHVLLVDVIPRERCDRARLHALIWAELDGVSSRRPATEPVTLASLVVAQPMRADVERVQFGEELPPMPVFLTSERYVSLPTETTYQQAWNGVPTYWQNCLQRRKRR